MKRHSHRIRLILPALVVLAEAAHYAAAPTQFSEWAAPANLGPGVNSPFNDFGPAIARDGLSLYFGSNRPGGFGGNDVYVSQRASEAEPWGAPINLGPNINTAFADNIPALSRDGHWMFLNSDRPGTLGGMDLWVSWRAHTRDDFGWQPPVNLGPNVNTAFLDQGAGFFENDEAGVPQLFFTSDRPGGAGALDIYVSALAADGSFGPAVSVSELNSAQGDQRPTIGFDGLEVVFFSNRPGSLGGFDFWTSTRETVFQPWSLPLNIGAIVNSGSNEQTPYLSSDRRSLFFASDRPGGSGSLDLYVTTRQRVAGQ
jgi:hypothetical protein